MTTESLDKYEPLNRKLAIFTVDNAKTMDETNTLKLAGINFEVKAVITHTTDPVARQKLQDANRLIEEAMP